MKQKTKKTTKKIAKARKEKARYVDGFVLVVPKKNTAAYRKIAARAGKVWMKYGALDYKECMIDDAKPDKVLMPFAKMIKAKPGENVWFSYITYKSRAHRDAVNKKVMEDPFMNGPQYTDKSMPFDIRRMAYAGFKVIVDAA